MQDSGIPAKFSKPFGASAGVGNIRTIPTASQIGVQNGAASLTDGFPPSTFLPIASGGSWPFGQDFNGILNQITSWDQWLQAGGPITYDATFQTAVGGYPNGAVVQSATTAGLYWRSTADNNTTNPDTGGAGWTVNVQGFPINWGSLSASTSLIPAQSGTFFNVGGAATTQTLPTSSTVPGKAFGFLAISAFTLAAASGGFTGGSISGTSISLSAGQFICVQSDGTNWRVFAMDPAIPFTLGQSVGSNGYQKIPGGLLLQWGTATLPNSGSNSSAVTVTLPIAWPTGLLSASGGATGAVNSVSGGLPSTGFTGSTLTTLTITCDSLGYALYNQTVTVRWLAVGH